MRPRIPADTQSRARLLRLAQRATEICQNWRYRTLALIADTAAAALVELAIAEASAAAAERSIAEAQVRIDDLKRKLREETFDEDTKQTDEELAEKLRRRSRSDMVKIVG